MTLKVAPTNERVQFRLLQMPCCNILICWVNPRRPMYCSECGTRVFHAFPKDRWEEQQSEAWLRVSDYNKATWVKCELSRIFWGTSDYITECQTPEATYSSPFVESNWSQGICDATWQLRGTRIHLRIAQAGVGYELYMFVKYSQE